MVAKTRKPRVTALPAKTTSGDRQNRDRAILCWGIAMSALDQLQSWTEDVEAELRTAKADPEIIETIEGITSEIISAWQNIACKSPPLIEVSPGTGRGLVVAPH